MTSELSAGLNSLQRLKVFQVKNYPIIGESDLITALSSLPRLKALYLNLSDIELLIQFEYLEELTIGCILRDNRQKSAKNFDMRRISY